MGLITDDRKTSVPSKRMFDLASLRQIKFNRLKSYSKF